MKKILFFAIFSLPFSIIKAQEVSSSGTLPVEIPIHTLKDGNFELPISMSYNTSGVRADEVASNVGLNWTLNVGAKIVKEIKDKPDEAFLGLDNRGYDNCGTGWHYWGYKIGTYPAFSETNQNKFYFLRDLEPDTYHLYLNGKSYPFIIASGGVEKNGIRIILLNENEDIYIEYLENEYNYLQNPVEANPVFDNEMDSKIHNFTRDVKLRQCLNTFPFANYKPNTSFKVTDSDGQVYYFGLDVKSREYSFTPETLDASNYLTVVGQDSKREKHTVAGTIVSSPVAWMLSKIVKPKGVIQPFDKYKQEDKYQEINFNYSRAISVTQTAVFKVDPTKEILAGPPHLTQTYSTSSYSNDDHMVYLEAQLNNIESDNFTIKFNANEIFSLGNSITNMSSIVPNYSSTDFTNTQRLDIDGSEYLDSEIKINLGLAYNPKFPNFLKTIPKSVLIRNILILDKATNKKMGFYFDYSYSGQRERFTGVGDIDRRRHTRLVLNGIYPIEIGSTTSKLINGHTFRYNPTELPGKFFGRWDHWGYQNNLSPNLSNEQPMQIGVPIWNETNMTSATCVNGFCNPEKEPVLQYAQAGILTQIIFPEGGNSSFEYELHDASNYYRSKTSGVKNDFRKIGGLRIKKVTSYDPVTNTTLIKKYSYLNPNSGFGESSGYLSIWPGYDYNMLSRVPTTQTTSGIFFTDPTNASFKFIPNKTYSNGFYWKQLLSKHINGNYITYKNIKVEQTAIINSIETSNGYTMYEFNVSEKQPYAILQSNGQLSYDVENPAVNGTCFNAFRYFGWNTPTYDFLKGTLKKVSIYKNGLTLPIKTTEYQYTTTDLTNTYDIKGAYLLPQTSIDVNMTGSYKGQVLVSTGISLVAEFLPGPGWIAATVASLVEAAISSFIPFSDNTDYLDKIVQYKIPVNRVRLDKVINTDFDLNGLLPIQTTSTYGYSNNHNEPISISTITKNTSTTYPSSVSEEKVEQNIKYLKDFTTSGATSSEGLALKMMYDRKLNIPIEIISKKNNLIIGGVYKEYHNDVNMIGLEKTVHSLELSAPLSSFTLSNLTTTVTKNSGYKPTTQLKQYNAKGLISLYSLNKGPETTINYGYNNNFPVGIILSSNFTSVSKSTLYEYDSPLYGINKVTTPDGNSQKIEFDNLGRQKIVRNKDGNILQSYNYNYVAKTYPNINPTIILQKIASGTYIDVKTLVNGDFYAVNGSNITDVLNIKVTTPIVSSSIVVFFDNGFEWKSNFANNTNSVNVYVPTASIAGLTSSTDLMNLEAGFQGTVFTDGANGGQKIGECKVKVQIFSEADGKGDLIGQKQITFYF